MGMTAAEFDLDLDVFAGPFDLLMAVVLREEISLAEAIGDLLLIPPTPDTSHIRPTVSLERRLTLLRELLDRRRRFDFDELFADEDRLTQAVTLFALLEMHKRGEATWSQKELFGPIEVEVAE
jgi:segregation and condensation protein A